MAGLRRTRRGREKEGHNAQRRSAEAAEEGDRRAGGFSSDRAPSGGRKGSAGKGTLSVAMGSPLSPRRAPPSKGITPQKEHWLLFISPEGEFQSILK